MGESVRPNQKSVRTIKTFRVSFKYGFPASQTALVKARDISSAVRKAGVPANSITKVEVV